MKRLILIFSAIAFLNACVQLDEFDQPIHGTTTGSGVIPEIIYANIGEGNEAEDSVTTRTYVANDKNILWHGGDEICYYAENLHQMKYRYNGEDGETIAEFTKVSGVPSQTSFQLSRSYAIYPYGAGGPCTKENTVEKFRVYFTPDQTYTPNSFSKNSNVMIAVGKHSSDDELYFRNVCGYLVIKLYGAAGTKVKKIRLTALGGEKIAGYGIVEPHHDAAPEVTMTDDGESTVILNCGEGVTIGTDNASATEFWFALPPTTFSEGFKIKVTPAEGGAFEMETSKRIVISRRDIQPMAALRFTANSQSEQQLIYTRASNTEPLTFYEDMANPFDANITRHYYDEDKKHFVIEFDRPLKAIGNNAFRGSKVKELVSEGYDPPQNVTDITSVILPESLETIGHFAFAGSALRELTIPGNVKLVGYYAFWECRSLESISILEGSSSLTMYANALSSARGVFGFSPLRHIYVNRDIKLRNYDPVSDYVSPEDIEFNYGNVHEGVFSLSPDGAKDYPGKVDDVQVELGPKLTTILPYMFAGRDIKSITIPETVTHIGYEAFNCCRSLESISIPSSVETIGQWAFYRCEGMKSATIGAHTLNNCAFYQCRNLESVTIKGTVNMIDNDVFYGCNNLKTLTLEPSPTATPLTLGYQTFGTDDQSPFYDAPLEKLNWNRDISYSLANEGTLDSTNEGLFSDKDNLTDATLGEQVQSLPPYTFACTGLTSISIPENTTAIGDYAFYDSDKLTRVDLNNKITTIGKRAFYDCGGLTEVSVPASVRTLGEYAFYNCDALQTASLGAATIDKGVLYDCDELVTVTIEGSVNSIANDPFYSCGNLKNVTFSPSATKTTLTLGYQTYGTDQQGPFYDAPLQSVNWGRDISYTLFTEGGLDAIDEGLFSDKENLKTVTIGTQVKTIPPHTFNESGLTSITIPGNVEYVGHSSFKYCSDLADVRIEDSSSALVLGNQLHNSAWWGTFYDCPLASIYLGRDIDYRDSDGNAYKLDEWEDGVFANDFYSTSTLTTTVEISSYVTKIHDYMFSGVRMENITIPSSVKSIGKEAFYDCRILTHVTAEGANAPTLGEDAFDSCDKLPSSKCIAVPSGSLSDYQSKWSQCIDLLYVKNAQ